MAASGQIQRVDLIRAALASDNQTDIYMDTGVVQALKVSNSVVLVWLAPTWISCDWLRLRPDTSISRPPRTPKHHAFTKLFNVSMSFTAVCMIPGSGRKSCERQQGLHLGFCALGVKLRQLWHDQQSSDADDDRCHIVSNACGSKIRTRQDSSGLSQETVAVSRKSQA